jgi:hypothetical protein
MNQGNALAGFVLLGALATVYPVAAAIIGGLILLEVLIRRVPLAVVRTMRVRRQWHAVPLQQRSMTRAAGGGFVLALCAVFGLHGFPVIGWKVTAGMAALALLYLAAGIYGTRGARIDFVSVFWWAVVVIAAGASLTFLGFRL